jgi:hypothetical protein
MNKKAAFFFCVQISQQTYHLPPTHAPPPRASFISGGFAFSTILATRSRFLFVLLSRCFINDVLRSTEEEEYRPLLLLQLEEKAAYVAAAAAAAVCFFWSSGRKRAPAAAAGKEKFYVTDCIELTLFLCGWASAGLKSSRIFATGLIINGTVAITLKFFPCLHRREKKAL